MDVAGFISVGGGVVFEEVGVARLRSSGQWSLPNTSFLMTQSQISFTRRSDTTK